MTKLEQTFRQKLKAIEKTKKTISDLRDILRNQFDDLEGILDSCNEAVELLEEGTRSLSDAADVLSQYL